MKQCILSPSLRVAQVVIDYLNDVKDASKHFQLLAKVLSLQTLLKSLKTRVDEAAAGYHLLMTIRGLGMSHGPLEQIKAVFGCIGMKMRPVIRTDLSASCETRKSPSNFPNAMFLEDSRKDKVVHREGGDCAKRYSKILRW